MFSHDAEGCSVAFRLAGAQASSSRAELAGFIVAMLGPGAVHVGIDNASVVAHAQQLIAGGTHRHPAGWGLTRDGDLWELAEACLLAKGRHAVLVSKVKGHATETDVGSGVVVDRDRWGNERADNIATAATEGWPNDAAPLTRALLDRQQDYGRLVARIQALIRRTLRADKAMREAKLAALAEAARLSDDDDRVRVSIPYHGDAARARHLTLRPATNARHATIRSFLLKFPWQPVSSDQQGVSWMELIVLFDCLSRPGHPFCLCDQDLSAGRHPTARALLLAFKREVRAVLRLHGGLFDHMLFKHCRSKGSRIAALGFTGHWPAIAALPVLPPCLADAVARRLLRQRGCPGEAVDNLFIGCPQCGT